MAKLVFKHEDHVRRVAIGPVWKVDDNGLWTNYEDGLRDWQGKVLPKWFTLPQARDFAKQLGVALEEV